MPFKLNQNRRHHIPKQKHRVTNWPAYDAALRQRGSLTVWFRDEAIAAWRAEPRTTRGGQASYSPLAITTALTLRAVFRLALRQTEGLIGSLIGLLGLDLPVPDHSTLCGRPGSSNHLLQSCAACFRSDTTTSSTPAPPRYRRGMRSSAALEKIRLRQSLLCVTVKDPVRSALMSGLSRGSSRWPSWVCACVPGTILSRALETQRGMRYCLNRRVTDSLSHHAVQQVLPD